MCWLIDRFGTIMSIPEEDAATLAEVFTDTVYFCAEFAF